METNKTRPDRDAKGRLLPGCKPCNPKGRPTAEREHELLGIMREEATPDVWRSITRMAIAEALEGLPGAGSARSWLAKYLLPLPTQQVSVDGSLAELLAKLTAPEGEPLDS